MLEHLWGDLHSRKNPLGNREVIQSATSASMDSIKNKYFYPNNALLIVGGDVDHDVIFRLIEKKYGDWKSSSFDPFKKWPVPEFKPLVKPDYFIVQSALSKSPYIAIEWQGPDTRNDLTSTYAADVFSYIVNQKSSKLSTALLQSGLAFSVSIGYLTLKHIGPISLTIVPNPSKIKECMDEVKRQIALMDNDNYFTDEQIETAKRILEIKQIREEDITSDYVHTLSFWWASASLNYFLNYNDKLNKVSRADLKAYVSKYIKDKPYCAGLLISPDLENQIKAGAFFKPN
jgi:zinc protease